MLESFLDWLMSNDKGQPDNDFNVDKFRGPYDYPTFKEGMSHVHHGFRDAEESFLAAMNTTDVSAFAYHYRRFLGKQRTADIFVQSALAMVRRNRELNYYELDAERAFRNFWRYVGFRFENRELTELLQSLQIAKVAPKEQMPMKGRRRGPIDIPDDIIAGIYMAGGLDVPTEGHGGFEHFS